MGSQALPAVVTRPRLLAALEAVKQQACSLEWVQSDSLSLAARGHAGLLDSQATMAQHLDEVAIVMRVAAGLEQDIRECAPEQLIEAVVRGGFAAVKGLQPFQLEPGRAYAFSIDGEHRLLRYVDVLVVPPASFVRVTSTEGGSRFRMISSTHISSITEITGEE